MQESFSIVREDQFIEATRDSGYKGSASALSELIDNSLQANATQVAIRMAAVDQEQENRGRPKQPRVVEVVIADNGRGMDKTTLRRSLRFGDGSRFGDRTGLGRFGMGLPNSSVSQCQRIEVYSWQRKEQPYSTYIDVKEIAAGKMKEVPEPHHVDVPPEYRDLVKSPSGTLIIWKRCDRLDHDNRLETLQRSLRHSMGRIFRYFLKADFDLTIDDTKVEPFDPLFLMPEARVAGDALATAHGDKIEFEIPIPGCEDQFSLVEVTFSLLPEEWQTKLRNDKKERGRRFLDSTSGFSIVRHGREIDLIKSPYHAKHWTDAWYRVEIRFEPELDEVFAVTHTKQHARLLLGSPIYERLKTVITANVNTMKDMIVARGKKAHKSRAGLAEEAASKAKPRLKPIEGLDEKPDTQVKAEIEVYLDQRRAGGLPESDARALEKRLAEYEILVELEALPGAPFYRTKIVGRSVIVMLNTEHPFYERVFRRLENESPIAKTGVELLLMTLARAELLGSEDCQEWYEDQRHEWSGHLKVFLGQIEEIDPSDERSTEGEAE